jgi:hypothetical protein
VCGWVHSNAHQTAQPNLAVESQRHITGFPYVQDTTVFGAEGTNCISSGDWPNKIVIYFYYRSQKHCLMKKEAGCGVMAMKSF